MKKIYKIIALLVLLITSLIGSYTIPRIVCEPHRNLEVLVDQSKDNTKSIFNSSAGFLQYHPYGYIVVLYLGEHSEYAPVEYLTISKVNDIKYVEIITGAGPENARRISSIYLKKIDIDISPLEASWRRRYD